MPRSTPPAVRLLALACIWGSSFLFIKVALDAFAPAQLVLGRLVAGALVLLAVSAARRQRLPGPGPVWWHFAVIAAVANVVPFLLFAWGEQRVPSSTAGVLNATTPLFTLLCAVVALRSERPTVGRVTGVVVGFAGAVLVVGGAGGGSVPGELACLVAAACYGLAFVLMRRLLTPTGLSPLVLSTGQVSVAAVEMAVLTPLLARRVPSFAPGSVLAVLALGALGTGLAYLLNFSLVRDIGATGASMVTYLIPIAAVGLGVAVLGERLAWNVVAGAAVVILGVALAEGRVPPRRRVQAVVVPTEGFQAGRVRS